MNKKILICLMSVVSTACMGKIKEYDVCVYCGTPGGITAAISPSREGASVVLLEQTRHVGGLSTSGLNRDEGNHLDRQTLGGLCEQFLEEAVKRSKGRWTEGGARTWQSGIAEQLFLEMLNQAGKVEWGQPPGVGPAPVNRESSNTHTAGIFLLAASEVYKLGL